MSSVGIVLSGGIVKGAYQVGVLKAINEYLSNSITCISASSIGVLNAYAFQTGKTEQLEDMWRNALNYSGCSTISSFIRGSYLENIISKIVEKDDMISSSLFSTLLNVKGLSLVNSSGPTIEYVDLKKVSRNYIENYLLASVNLPLIKRPVNISGNKYYDGAFVDNIPIAPLSTRGLDYIICVHFDDYNYSFDSKSLNKKTIKINFPDDNFIKNAISFKQENINYMLDYGYEHSKFILDLIFSEGTEELDLVYKNIVHLNSLSCQKRRRIGMDSYAINLNKIAKRIAFKKEIYD